MRRLALGLTLLALAGCSRGHYRKSADREVYPVIAERVVSPAYAVGKITVEAAPQSRIADPTSPDRPAKPPDDAAAAGFMSHPGKFRGARGWDEDGVIDRIEPDGWEACLGLEPQQVRLTLGGVGGAFGAREDISLQVHTCLLALRTGRPVRMAYSRAESFLGHVHRHPGRRLKTP